MITLLWPTVRPATAYASALKWVASAADEDRLEIWFGVNSDAEKAVLVACEQRTPMSFSPRFCVYKNSRPGVTDTVTRMTREQAAISDNYEDIFVLASDDFSSPQNWDEHLREQYSGKSGVLQVEDDYPPTTNILPMPVVDGLTLKQLNGILYHPVYHHYYSDEELYYVCVELKMLKNLRGVNGMPQFKHHHWSFKGGRQKDEIDNRTQQHWQHDKAMYLSRQALSVEEKLKLPDWWVD